MSYTPPGRSESGEMDFSYLEDEAGYGLVTFAGVMLMIIAVLNTIYGIAAIDGANPFFVGEMRVTCSATSTTWGWFLLALGILQFFAALAVWRGVSWGRWFRRRVRKRPRDPADPVDPGLSGHSR